MIKYDSVQELADKAVKVKRKISDLVIQQQSQELKCSEKVLLTEMTENLKVMEEAVSIGINSTKKSTSGLSGGDAYKLNNAVNLGITVGGRVLGSALSKALAVAEVNACMGKIVAAPTAGSCGIIPAVLITAKEEKKIPTIKVVRSLFTSAGIGMVIAKRACISGAQGGCQAECGSASAMAAAAVVEMVGGTPYMCINACAIALKNVLGLICDPVAGLVEVPCVKRNALGAANALVAADLALAGIESVIPVDEVIDALKSVGNLMVPALKETALGGIAATPTACEITKRIFKA